MLLRFLLVFNSLFSNYVYYLIMLALIMTTSPSQWQLLFIMNYMNYLLLCYYHSLLIINNYIISFLIYLILSVILFNYNIFIFFFVSMPADPNSVPHDLPEAESELMAGLITEYSTIYFPLILLTEYGNIITLTHLIIITFPINPFSFVFILYFMCLIRSTLNSLKSDELMTTARLVILPIMFPFPLLLSMTN